MDLKTLVSNISADNPANFLFFVLTELKQELKNAALEAVEEDNVARAMTLLNVSAKLDSLLTKTDLEEAKIKPEEPLTIEPFASNDLILAPRITDAEIELMGSLLVSYMQPPNPLLKTDVYYSSRAIYDIVEKNYLSKLSQEETERFGFYLPLTERRQDRPKWKELISQVLAILVKDGFLNKTGRCNYRISKEYKAELMKAAPAPVTVEAPVYIEDKPGKVSMPFQPPTSPVVYGIPKIA